MENKVLKSIVVNLSIDKIAGNLISPDIRARILYNSSQDTTSSLKEALDSTKYLCAAYLTMCIELYYKNEIIRHYIYSIIDVDNNKCIEILYNDAILKCPMTLECIPASNLSIMHNRQILLTNAEYCNIINTELIKLVNKKCNREG
jgi:hypothetical protein